MSVCLPVLQKNILHFHTNCKEIGTFAPFFGLLLLIWKMIWYCNCTNAKLLNTFCEVYYLKVDFGEKYYNLFVKRITPHLGKGSCCEFCWDIFNGTLCEKSGNKSSPNMCSTWYTSASGTSIAQQVVILSLARPLFLMSPLQYGDLWIIFIEWFLYWKGVMLWIIF